jgi:hypothetical protein
MFFFCVLNVCTNLLLLSISCSNTFFVMQFLWVLLGYANSDMCDFDLRYWSRDINLLSTGKSMFVSFATGFVSFTRLPTNNRYRICLGKFSVFLAIV